MKKYLATFLTIALMISFVSVAAVAQPFGGTGGGSGNSKNGGVSGPGQGNKGLSRGNVLGMNGLMALELTEQQREQIRLLMEEHQAAAEAEREMNQERMQALRAAQAEIMEADYFDEAAAYEVLAEKGALNIERQLIRQRFQHRVLNEILTEEQKDQLQNMWRNQAAFGAGAGQGIGPGEGLGECPYM